MIGKNNANRVNCSFSVDLPLNFHPAAVRAWAGFTPCGAGEASCERRSWSGLRSRSGLPHGAWLSGPPEFCNEIGVRAQYSFG